MYTYTEEMTSYISSSEKNILPVRVAQQIVDAGRCNTEGPNGTAGVAQGQRPHLLVAMPAVQSGSPAPAQTPLQACPVLARAEVEGKDTSAARARSHKRAGVTVLQSRGYQQSTREMR